MVLSAWHDYCAVTVLTEHLGWWVQLFRLVSPLTYNEWDRQLVDDLLAGGNRKSGGPP